MAEKDWELTVLSQLNDLGWELTNGTGIQPGTSYTKREHDTRKPDSILPTYRAFRHCRDSNESLLIPGEVKDALRRLNPAATEDQVQRAYTTLTRPRSTNVMAENKEALGYMSTGIPVEMKAPDGTQRIRNLHVISADPTQNTYLAAQQVPVSSGERSYRLDIVMYCNGLPIGIIELKDQDKNLSEAYNQMATYQREIPQAFTYNVVTIMGQTHEARYGTIGTPFSHTAQWNYDSEGVETPNGTYEDECGQFSTPLNRIIQAFGTPEILLNMMRHFTLFVGTGSEEGSKSYVKILAKAHQYYAVREALDRAVKTHIGRGQVGVVWHTQGSGKSYSMLFFARAAMREKALLNPTIVVVTDRTDLDSQLYTTFKNAEDMLPDTPVKFESRRELKNRLNDIQAGGIFFTTLQKFGLAEGEEEYPQLSDRSNIIVMVDEAHRSHYDTLEGYAHNLNLALPRAKYIAFTGTPIDKDSRSTRSIFGDYIHTYSFDRAVTEGATVPLLYQLRHVKMGKSDGIDGISKSFDELSDLLEAEIAAKTTLEQTTVMKMLASDERLDEVARNIVEHWEERRELMREEMGDNTGKAMVVTSGREHAVRLFNKIIELRPDWAPEGGPQDVKTGCVQVLISGTPSDPEELSRFRRNGAAAREVERRIKDPNDPLEIIVVADRLLTGFDAPVLHTMYMDRLQKEHNLMQTIARINRTYKEKQSGLIVGFLPLHTNLRKALSKYATGQEDVNFDPSNRAQKLLEDLQNIYAQITEYLGDDWYAVAEAYSNGVGRSQEYTDALIRAQNKVLSYEQDAERSARDGGAQVSRNLGVVIDLYRQLVPVRDMPGIAEVLTPAMIARLDFLREVHKGVKNRRLTERAHGHVPHPEEIKQQMSLLFNKAVESNGTNIISVDDEGETTIDLRMLTDENIEYLSQLEVASLVAQNMADIVTMQIQNSLEGQQARVVYFMKRLEELLKRYNAFENKSSKELEELLLAVRSLATEAENDAERGRSLGLSAREVRVYDELCTVDILPQVLTQDELVMLARLLNDSIMDGASLDAADHSGKSALKGHVRRNLRKFRSVIERAGAVFTDVVDEVAGHLDQLSL
ncbi:hypothetical protein HMPREF2765_06375 [Rothia sp. HMSC062H08]|uniref:type I restriction endonuclease subunit R n=1 Tax=Rothia sp. HMSC062H08 TaxID=1739269 RepID=UPI0008A26D56|nr:type I restriction endonuclease subunit R [Rothia sp. HMSC062H08]OFL53446.1 hypothetical protein HMPREF2765_06375 [Rothia sp. HMSC062H08]